MSNKKVIVVGAGAAGVFAAGAAAENCAEVLLGAQPENRQEGADYGQGSL